MSYSPEYHRFRADPIVLKEIAEATWGKEIDLNQEPEQIAEQLYGDRKPRRSSRAIFEWFLMLFALLLPLDVAVRRVQMDAGWFLRLFRREKKESAATIGALLQRAVAVRSNMNAQKEGTDGPRAPLPEDARCRFELRTGRQHSRHPGPQSHSLRANPPVLLRPLQHREMRMPQRHDCWR